MEKGEAATDIVHQILASNLPPEDKTLNLVTREACAVALAGTESTGSTITAVVYYLLSQPEKGSRLRADLKGAYEKYGRPPRYHELKELPYLVRFRSSCGFYNADTHNRSVLLAKHFGEESGLDAYDDC